MTRRKPLVTQHLESISRKALERYQSIIHKLIHGRQGVYALFSRGKLYYVGLASNLRSRLRQHLSDRHRVSWDRFSVYLTIGDQHMKELEALILRIVKPQGNKVKGRFARSQNLMSQFKRELHEFHRMEDRELVSGLARTKEAASARLGARRTRSAGRVPVLAPFVSKWMMIRARYKGKWITARVRKNGTIRLDGKVYTSPSTAGQVAQHRVSCNGWKFWKYERSPGDWVLLEELKR